MGTTGYADYQTKASSWNIMVPLDQLSTTVRDDLEWNADLLGLSNL
jgi:hypothetical protein